MKKFSLVDMYADVNQEGVVVSLLEALNVICSEQVCSRALKSAYGILEKIEEDILTNPRRNASSAER